VRLVNTAQQINGPIDNRALLATVGHRLVRTVAAESTEHSLALYAILFQGGLSTGFRASAATFRAAMKCRAR